MHTILKLLLQVSVLVESPTQLEALCHLANGGDGVCGGGGTPLACVRLAICLSSCTLLLHPRGLTLLHATATSAEVCGRGGPGVYGGCSATCWGKRVYGGGQCYMLGYRGVCVSVHHPTMPLGVWVGCP